ncbi:MAG: FKBP-type peptidyl-prolyl cis-trans isomerase [Gammaproteobacteria bacterium]
MAIRTTMASALMALLAGLATAGEKVELKSENDKLNYSVGYQLGGDFRRQDVEINPEIVVRGMQDAIAGEKPLMTPKEMRSTLAGLSQRVAADKRDRHKQVAEQNLANGQAFLAENADKEGVKTTASGLQYKVIEAGSGESPKASDSVTVHYRGTLIDGTEFDSSYSRNKPATFRVDRVIPGWTEALKMMKPGAKWQLFIPPGLAYGERGPGPIPPNSTLIFDVELISVGG